MRKSRENGLFLNVPDEQWNDWKWQVENRIETLEDLKKYITLTEEEEEGIPKIIFLIAALAVAGQKMADAILQTGKLTGDELQKLVEMVMKLIKQREGEAKQC